MPLYKILRVFILCLCFSEVFSQACDPETPSFTFDLTGQPNGSYLSPEVRRKGLCCGLDPEANPPIRCVEFFFTLDSEAQGIRFEIASGAVPPGALGYQIGCGEYHMVGEDICLDGPGPHRLTFCKPGNNPNTYRIVSIPKPKVSPPITVSDGCTGMLSVAGLEEESIVWRSIPSAPVLESYLNCTLGCDTVIGTWREGAPEYIDYVVTGAPRGGCVGSVFYDTSRIYFVNDKTAEILPQDPVICYGGTSATLTAYGSGGAPPYTYLWSTGETTQSISVNTPGTYSVLVKDTTSCPEAEAEVIVRAYLSPTRANAGPDVTSCANNPNAVLTGSVQSASGGIWTGGNGTYSPSETSLTVTYTPTPAEIATGSVQHILTTTGTGDCPPHSDTTIMTISPAPTIDAGPNVSTCANNARAQLNGSVTIAAGAVWSGGNGTFTPGPTSLNPVYIPTASEIAAGSVTLTLTSTGNGQCLPVSDNMTVTITPPPTVNAGTDQTVCANNSQIQLNGSVTVATGGTWTGGTGTFSPNRNTLNATYTPSAAEIDAGYVSFTLTTTGNGSCNPVSDQVLINITPAPTITSSPAGMCSNSASGAQLSGSVTIASGISWSGGNGTFNPGRNALNPTYFPTAAEIASGSVLFTLTSTGNGNCLAVSGQSLLTFSPAPVVNAGPDNDVCANNATISLAGSVSGATGGTWSGGSGTFSPGRNALNTTYTPTSSEINSGSVTFTLTSTGNGSCLPVTDQVIYTITPAPIINAGADQNYCGTTPAANLSGTVSIASGGTWTGGQGTFSPSRNVLNPTYTPTPQEIELGSVNLTLTSTGNGKCLAVSDQINLAYQSQLPISNAGSDQELCGNVTSVNLNGTVSNAAGGIWTTSGTGNFSPSASTLNAIYQPSAGDISGGSVDLTLTTTGSFPCPEVSDILTINFTSLPNIEAGPDQTVCYNSETMVQFAASGNPGRWTGGAGTFQPNDSTLDASYRPDPSEVGSTVKFIITTLNSSCPSVKDSMEVTFLAGPEVNAIDDFTVCADTSFISLSSTVSVATQVSWTTTGNGTFSNPSAFSTDYTPTAEDTAAGRVIFTVTTVDNGSCPPFVDEVIVDITPIPVITGITDQVLCANVTEINLNTGVVRASNLQWSSTGSGSFSPGSIGLNPTYQVTPADTTAGSIYLIAETTGNGLCNPVTDSLAITFQPMPVAEAGGPLQSCENNPNVNLNGAIYNTSSGFWSSTGTGTFGSSGINNIYTPSPTDVALGSISLVLTADANQYCPAVNDSTLLTFTPAPFADAGPDLEICSVDDAQLAGSVTVSGTGIWTGNGSFAPSNTDLNAIYTPSAAEINAGQATLTLTTTNIGTCLPHSDQVRINIIPTPQANAGPDQDICRADESIALSGTLSLASGGTWTSSGSGNFLPSPTEENATYLLSEFDKSLNGLQFIFRASGNSGCPSISDTMNITFSEQPVVDLGAGTACADLSGIALDAIVTNVPSFQWNSSGTGTFSPNNSSTSVTYNPSAADLSIQTIMIRLNTSANGSCPGISDSVQVTFSAPPTADAGPDITVCADTSYINLTGSATNANIVEWSSSSQGGFNPTENSLNTSYILTGEDKDDGFAILVLSVYGHPLCEPARDTMNLIITPAPTLDIGGDTVVCPTVGGILPLDARLTVSSGGIWSTTGSGNFIPSNVGQSTYYQFAQNDYYTASIRFSFTSTGNGLCKAVSKSKNIRALPLPSVEAGIGQTICRDAEAVAYTGSYELAGGLQWSTSGSGTFYPSPNSEVIYYRPSAADKSQNSIMLYLQSTGGVCAPALDSVSLSFVDPPSANAGPDITVCVQSPSITLNGSVTNAPGAFWTSEGTGVFLPNNQNLNAEYTFSVQDTVSKFIDLALTSVGVDACYAEDSLRITLVPAPATSLHNVPACIGNNVTIMALPEGFASLPTTPVQWAKDGQPIPESSTTLIVNEEGTYTISFSMGDCQITDTTIVTYSPSPIPDMETFYEYCREDQNEVILDAGIASTYFWPVSQDTTQKIIATSEGYYPVVIFNEYGCPGYDTIFVNEACPPRLFPINAFSPNGDGINEYFTVNGAFFDNFSITIFNRWGEIIYYSEEPEPGWDGMYKGEPMPQGVYPYIIRYQAEDREYNSGENTVTGSVTLIR